MKLPESLRNALKDPIGILLKDKDATKENIAKLLPSGAYVVTVGDATTEKLLSFGLVPSLQIVDGLEKRTQRKPPESASATRLSCNNPPGEITTESITTIKDAFSMRPPVQIIVNGEEDLLVIPVCIYAPHNTVVMYGQPNEGLVAVEVTDEIRNKTKEILNLME